MKKIKTTKSGVFMQDSAIQPEQPVNKTNLYPLRDLDYTPIIVRPQNHGGAAKKKGAQVIRVLSDKEIEAMDERNEEVDAMTCEYIMSLIDEDDHTADDLGLDAEMVTNILDAFEQVLSDFGFYINRPTIVQREDGEHIIRSAYDDEPFDVNTREFVVMG